MSQSGSLVEVLVQVRGTQLVGDHISGATTLLVQDPTPLDEDGGRVFIDGTAYTYTALATVADTTDPSGVNGQLTLSSGLVQAETDLTPVQVWSGSQVLDDLVLLVATGDEGDPPSKITVRSEQRAFWEGRLGPVDPPIAVVLSDDLSLLEDAPGWTPSINGAQLVGLPDPAEIAIDPPVDSPVIKSVSGNATGLTVVTEPFPPTTLVDFLINGVVVAADQRTMVLNLTNDGTSALALDTDYTVTTQAHNSATDEDPSTLPAPSIGVTARLDPGVTADIVRAWAAFGFVLAGTIQVGAITIRPGDGDDPGGITIPLANGGVIDLPADGSDAVITALLRARAITVEDFFRLQGETNYIEGGLRWSNGVSAPAIKPRVGTSWDHTGASVPLLNQFGTGAYAIGFGIHRGGFWDAAATRYLHTLSVFGGGVESTDLSTGVTSPLFSLPSLFSPFGGVVRIGTNYYVLGSDGNRSGRWFVYKYNSSFVKQLEWEFTPAGTSPQTPQMFLNGSNLMIAYWTTDAVPQQKIIATNFAPDTGVAGGTINAVDASTPKATLTFGFIGTGPYGSGTYLVVGSSNVTRVYSVSGTTGTRDTTREWSPPNGDTQFGAAYNGTRWIVLGGSNALWNLSLNFVTAVRSITSTKYDSDATGGTHETPASPANAYSHRAGEYLRVDLDPPGDAGGTDDPDSVRIYIANHRMADLGAGVTTAIYDTVSAAGAAAPTTNTFPVAAAPGYSRSDAEDGNGALTYDDGAGRWRRAGVNLDDVALTALTPASGFAFTGGTLGYQVKNGMVYVFANFTATTGTPFTGSAEVFIVGASGIPASLRPAVNAASGARITGGGFNPGAMSVLTDGSVSVTNAAAGNRSTLRATVCYPKP